VKLIWLGALAPALALLISCGGGVSPVSPESVPLAQEAENEKNAAAPTQWTLADGKFGASAINDIVYTGQKFIAVGDNGKLSWAWATSPGEWTAWPHRGAYYDGELYPYAYTQENVLDGTDPIPNGNTTQFLAAESIKAVAFGGNDFLFWAGEGATNDTGMGCRIQYDLYDLNLKGEKVVAAGVSRLNGHNNYPHNAVGNSRFGRGTINDITHSGIYFVIVGNDGRMSVSKDTAQNWYPVSNVANKFCSTGETDITKYDQAGYHIYAAAFGGTKFVAAGANGVISWAIPDNTWKQSGTTAGTSWITDPPPPEWTRVDTTAAFGTTTIYALAYSAEKKIWVAAGANGAIAWSSDNAETWTSASGTFGGSTVYALAYGGGKFLAGGADGKLAYSYDGKNWTAVPTAVFGTNTIQAIAYGQGRFTAAGENGVLAYSDRQEIIDRPFYSLIPGGEAE
jgi:hypothetical protein